jgi:hypothetical protein
MTKQEKLNPISHEKRLSLLLIPFLTIFATLFIIGGTAKGFPGDQWILPIDHTDGSGFIHWGGAGYDGTEALEATGFDGVRRVYWALNGQSTTNNSLFPITTEQYTIEWFQPTTGATDWQPIESRLRGSGGDDIQPGIDPLIPWAGSISQNHQWIAAQGSDGTPGTWTTTGPGPHTPNSPSYNAGDNGIYMWLTRGAWLWAKWNFGFSIDHTWSALRLTQVTATRPVITSVSKSGNNVTLTWSAGGGGNYQVQYKTNLTQIGWSNLGDTIPANNLTTSTTDVNPPDARRYYRVQVLP